MSASSRAAEDRRTTPAPAYRATLRAYLAPQRGRALLLGLLMLVDISLDLLGPQIERRFIDRALEGAPLAELWRLALLLLAIAAAVQLLFVASNYLATDLAQSGTNRLREELLGRLLALGPGFHDRHRPGSLIERVDGDVALLGNFLSRFLLELVGSLLLLAGTLALLWRVDWRIGALLGLVAVGGILFLRLLAGPGRRRWDADRAAQADLFGFLEERLAGTEDLRAAGATEHAMHGFFEQTRRAARKRITAGLFASISASSANLLLGIGTALTLGLGAWLYAGGQISVGTIYLIFRYSQLLQGPIDALARQAADLQQAGAALTRIGRLQAQQPAVSDPAEPRPLPAGALSLSISDLRFGYRPDRPVLRGIDLELPAGSHLGLVGRTGSGKTSLTRLLFRLLDPDAGSLRLAGIDLRQLALADLRGRVALVTQDVQLFHASLRDNLSFFDPDLPDARLVEALDAVGLSPWLSGLPEGLDSPIAPGGSDLSAGQAQLLALARVFLRDPGLVILDEASSRLDPATEARVQAALDRLMAGRSAILIAHRLQTLRRVDCIAILADGRIVEEGPREALAADPTSRYAQLLRTAEMAQAGRTDEDLQAALDRLAWLDEGSETSA